MARSYRRQPIAGLTNARSDKPGKRLAVRRLRTAVHRNLRAGTWEILPHARDFGSSWSFPKDGKAWYGARGERTLRRVLRK